MFADESLSVMIFALALTAILVILIVRMFIPQKPLLCVSCLSQAKPKIKTKGSILIEIILWICLIIPGLIYSLWRLTAKVKVCPACGSELMIPIDSPRAQQLLL